MAKHILFMLLAGILIFSCQSALAESNAEPESKNFQKIWKDFSKVSNDAIDLAIDKGRNSKSLMETLTLRQPKYVRLLKEAQEILGTSEAGDQFDEIDRLYLKNKEMEAELVELKRKRVAAPESSYNPLKDTVKSIDRKLKEIPEKIQANKARIADLQLEISATLRKSGLDLTPEQLNYFMISAEGEELVQLMTIANNMKKIQKVIEEELANDSNNVGLAKAYAGMYLVSLDAYDNAHDQALKNIFGYREKLKAIRQEATRNYNDARELERRVDEGDRANVEANLRINQKTSEVAQMYDSLLQRRARNLEQSKSKLRSKIDLARNTYKTIINGSSLITLVNNGANEYALIMNFEMPELQTLHDTPILNSFMDISEKIKAEK